eukprot:8274724-Prorocentrum_lima.AAC.1
MASSPSTWPSGASVGAKVPVIPTPLPLTSVADTGGTTQEWLHAIQTGLQSGAQTDPAPRMGAIPEDGSGSGHSLARLSLIHI